MQAIRKPHILLPKNDVDIYKWAVIACDQFTAEPEYWDSVEKLVCAAPSTLRIMYPEVYLNEDENAKTARLKTIKEEMEKYLKMGLFEEHNNYIYVERECQGRKRHGIMAEVDLDQYLYTPTAQSLVRPTEGTIVERLPPRIRIRSNASLELPHILVLIDDPEKKVIEPLGKKVSEMKKAYDTKLMLDGGHVVGYDIPDAIAKEFEAQINNLLLPAEQTKKYGAGHSPIVFAIGDGNHSLATAKSVWEELKQKGADPNTHPARFALIEINNIHDDGLIFEPIHRVLFKTPSDPIEGLKKFYPEKVTFEAMPFEEACEKVKLNGNAAPHKLAIISPEKAQTGLITIRDPKAPLCVGSLQPFLDGFVGKNDIDYVHDTKPVVHHGTIKGQCGFFLPAMAKSDLFIGVVKGGVVPRKTFSMGESVEKRYYLETRIIVPGVKI